MAKLNTDILDLEEDINFEGKNEFAKNYDQWRKKEELNKIKAKYGEEALEDSDSSSSDDDENGAELTEEVEKDFFKTLSYLKRKDPKIYNKEVNFFKPNESDTKKVKKKKNEPMFIKDYERKMIVENGGVLSDEDETPRSPTYVEEQKLLKQSLKNALSNISDDEDENYLTKKGKQSKKNLNTEGYKKWLAGKDEIEDDNIKSELKPLKDFWNDPNLDDGEKFLRDYILNKKYLDTEQEDYIPSYDEIIHDSDDSLSGDEKAIEEQEEFEHKYNFRFEEPDQEFIKRYPRTIEKSLRKTDDRRKVKRAETKLRKQQEKEEKMAEIQKLKEIKKKEIEEKIEKLKEITGNTDVSFQQNDLDEDFDPEAYDKRMKALFSDEFYQGEEGEQKPEFPDIDEELEIENWERWNGEEHERKTDQTEPHCEDDDFNMDADYGPSTSTRDELIENSKGRKKRKRKSKVAEALNQPKPKYDPNDKNYEKYFDEYYKLDCEDIIGDIPCRFKYREVVPNNFGLSVEEILLAKDKELNKWCSLKKTMQHRPENVEKYDQIAYSKKANNISLKQKVLPSLFSEQPNEITNMEVKPTQEIGKATDHQEKLVESVEKISEGIEDVEKPREKVNKKNNINAEKQNKKKSKNKKTSNNSRNIIDEEQNQSNEEIKCEVNSDTTINRSENRIQENDQTKKSVKNKKRKHESGNNRGGNKFKKNNKSTTDISDARLSAYGINPKKFKNKLKYGSK